jgi:hypothetical protein
MNLFIAIAFFGVAVLTMFKVFNFDDNNLIILFSLTMSSIFALKHEIKEVRTKLKI